MRAATAKAVAEKRAALPVTCACEQPSHSKSWAAAMDQPSSQSLPSSTLKGSPEEEVPEETPSSMRSPGISRGHPRGMLSLDLEGYSESFSSRLHSPQSLSEPMDEYDKTNDDDDEEEDTNKRKRRLRGPEEGRTRNPNSSSSSKLASSFFSLRWCLLLLMVMLASCQAESTAVDVTMPDQALARPPLANETVVKIAAPDTEQNYDAADYNEDRGGGSSEFEYEDDYDNGQFVDLQPKKDDEWWSERGFQHAKHSEHARRMFEQYREETCRKTTNWTVITWREQFADWEHNSFLQQLRVTLLPETRDGNYVSVTRADFSRMPFEMFAAKRTSRCSVDDRSLIPRDPMKEEQDKFEDALANTLFQISNEQLELSQRQHQKRLEESENATTTVAPSTRRSTTSTTQSTVVRKTRGAVEEEEEDVELQRAIEVNSTTAPLAELREVSSTLRRRSS